MFDYRIVCVDTGYTHSHIPNVGTGDNPVQSRDGAGVGAGVHTAGPVGTSCCASAPPFTKARCRRHCA
jgi:hypothetical protein